MCDWLDRLNSDDADGAELLRELLDPDDGFDSMQELIQRVALDELEAERIKGAFLRAGCRPGEFSSILTIIKRRAAEMRGDIRTGNAKPDRCSVVPGVIPVGYLADEQIWKIIKRGDQEAMVIACHAPCWVSRRMVDADDYTETWELSWVEKGETRTAQCPRSMAQTARSIVALADQGLPVSSDTAGHLVAFLESYVARNVDLIPTVRVARRMGWFGGRFVWGADSGVEVAKGNSGLSRIAAACHVKADAKAEASLHELRLRYAPLMAVYAASLASPVLHLLRHPGFVVSLDGRTSSGKTTAIKLAASAWGNPDENEGLVYMWNETAKFMQNRACELAHLPLCIDETKQWEGRPAQLSKCVYDLTKGSERGRMLSGRQAQEQRSWRLVTFSTGEDPLAQSSESGGLRARVLSMWGSPFGGSALDDVVVCNRATAAHYGVDGPRWVKLLEERGAELIEHRADAWLSNHPVEGDVGRRLAAHAALVAAVAWTAAEWLRWPLDGWQCASLAWHALLPGMVSADVDADPAQRGWDELQAWLVSLGTEMKAGSAVVGRKHDGEWQLVPGALKRWAEDSGYLLASLLKAWGETGRLIRREGERATCKVQWGSMRPRLYCLRMESGCEE